MPRIIIHGIVQGVGFRPTVYRVARQLGMKGHVLNTGSNVEIVIDGDADIFIDSLRKALPPLARMDDCQVEKCPVPIEGFLIIPSSKGQRSSPLPPDAGICPDCLEELFRPGNKRQYYPFINCTNCGARFSVIADLPYDRPNTSMDDFPMCKTCAGEYSDPLDRRFHAQTTSCPDCGPHYRLEGVPTNDPVGMFAMAIDAGKIGAVKGWGGTHIICIPSKVGYLRERFNRSQKPLAVMVRNLETARKYAHISEHGEKLLNSTARPIVLLDRIGTALEDTAPGLDRIGIYLPYNGLHHLLFSKLDTDALIMTSGNLPGEPMAVTDEEIMKLAADVFLIHNRRIINRTDDSVIIPYLDEQFFVRKSRGYVPDPMPLPHGRTLVAVGADMNNTGGISVNGKAILTQHIGDIGRYETSQFLENAIKHLMRLYGIEKPDAVITDMHPRYSSRNVGKRLAEEWCVPTVEIQHHAAHAFALAAEHGLDELTVLACDGTGYGTDGQVWGGEVLSVRKGSFTRTGHLGYIPLLGGDKAVEDPRRTVFAISDILGLEQPYFSETEQETLHSMMKSGIRTSSTGRVLDALSCWLGICDTMTYDGEPAMKLEPFIRKGRPAHEFHATVKSGIVDTLGLFAQLAEVSSPEKHPEPGKTADLARSFVDALFEGFVEAAEPTDALGFTGGVSYNLAINDILSEILDKIGVKFIIHRRVPNGDGGVSFGQLSGGGYYLSGSSG
ncbi:MAG: carbamoyltransferase HypF [Candidatus Thermoplasmatota archaeon]|nr:carbamoyltransferase HypF [Euryarchaeota archaeon]MBU4032257.1 carbamoyltransferase HypF [Candidatus Thermoplasmatota archaeon]MBU4071134.1 carbamoyltransferase HypF [Candidatus Thermoplasmatota archaeon]MBU4143705.1 carbamoyltransferase HypF [Candidatus Thermoplasmatota archaeon]MBU4591781.1 carbamoyltransferase HypF [Candidatus Thermoplasmatota archaeon]